MGRGKNYSFICIYKYDVYYWIFFFGGGYIFEVVLIVICIVNILYLMVL